MLKTEATAATAAKIVEMTLHARARRVSFKALRCSCSARRASSPDPDFIQTVRADGIVLPDEVIQSSEGDVDLHPGIMENLLTVLWELLRGAGEGAELAEHGIRHNDHPFSGEMLQG